MSLRPEANGHVVELAGIASSMDQELYEALGLLIHKIYMDQYAGRVHTVVLTASEVCSGVSYLASCMATVLGQTLGPTVLVDGLVLSRLARAGKLPRRLNCTHIDGAELWYLGAAEANCMTSIPSAKAGMLKAVLDSLGEDFDYVIVDAPALSVSGLVEALAPIIDGIVLVAVKDRSDIRDLEAARSRLAVLGGTLLGSIYNTKMIDSRNGETR